MSGTHLSISLRTRFPSACGVRSASAGRSAPSSASRLATLSSRIALSSAELICATIGCGVPFGKNSAGKDVRRRGDDLIEHQIDLSREEIIDALGKATIRHVLDLGLREAGVEQIGEMGDRAGAGAA